jgi:hypothetical protein
VFLETAGLGVTDPYIRDFSMFNVCSSGKNPLDARCVSTENVVCRDSDVLETKTVSLNGIL